MKNTVCVMGDGAWGTAVALLLADNGHDVKLWCYDPCNAKTIAKKRINKRYLPSTILPTSIIPVTDIAQALEDVQWIFEAIPVQYLRSTIQKMVPYLAPQHQWVVLSKGIEQQTCMLPTQIIDDICGRNNAHIVVSGPSFATELAAKKTTAVMVAGHNLLMIETVQRMLNNSYFSSSTSSDEKGVQIGGAIKNIIALAVGILDGAGYGDNAKALCITRGLHEMVLISQAIGGKQDTIYSLAGVGDLILTTSSLLSKNRHIGQLLGQGVSLSASIEKTGYIPEGINTVQSVYHGIIASQLQLPLCAAVYNIAFNQADHVSLNHVLMMPF